MTRFLVFARTYLAGVRWWMLLILSIAVLIHVGTAVLRLPAFVPFPQLVDFSTFYSSGWAIRLHISPYQSSETFLQFLQEQASVPHTPPAAYNPPLFYILIYPVTLLSYPVAAWIWVLLNVLVLLWASRKLARLARLDSLAGWLFLFPLVLTFGPISLDLTLGQLSTVLMAIVLLIGSCLRTPTCTALQAGILGALAASIKVYPLLWLGQWVLVKRWRYLCGFFFVLVASLVLVALIGPRNLLVDWFHLFVDRVSTANQQPALDDQSLMAWLDRMGRPQTFDVPGLSTDDSDIVTWTPPWQLDPAFLRLGGYIVSALLTVAVSWIIWEDRQEHLEGTFYLWVLVGLVIFPHMARYNHALLLPAMAWLWGRGRQGQIFVILAYFLTALARLTHLWMRLLPGMWAPLITGSGLLASLALIGGVCLYIASPVRAQRAYATLEER